MAHIFSGVVGGSGLDLWYHFAIMFEALFILTTIDAGTRVGRYLLQDLLGHFWKPLGATHDLKANLAASSLLVLGWGYFLVQGVRDPLGGINSLWPLFGIANQMLAAIALCLATTIILKMQLAGKGSVAAAEMNDAEPSPVMPPRKGRPIFALVTLIPLAWLLAVTFTAGAEKIWHPDPKIGFFAAAQAADTKREQLRTSLAEASTDALTTQNKEITQLTRQAFNFRLDAAVTLTFLVMVSAILLISIREWLLLLARKKLAELRETPPTWLPEYAVGEGRPLRILGWLALAVALARELSGEAQLERARQQVCTCHEAPAKTPEVLYVQTTEERFNGVRRCC
jgi:carbon starvation protein